MNSKKIAAVTFLLMAVSIVGFTIFLSSSGPNSWALPVEVAILAVISTVGMVLAWRARGH